jgi:metal-sulfur cluster biosynthetic enzyme
MALSEDIIREELKKVVDPELFVNIIDLGLVYSIDITPVCAVETQSPGDPPQDAQMSQQSDATAGNVPASVQDTATDSPESAESTGATKHHVRIEMTMTSPLCPAGPQLIANCKQVLSQLPEVGSVEVKIVLDPPWTPDRMTEAARDQLGIF